MMTNPPAERHPRIDYGHFVLRLGISVVPGLAREAPVVIPWEYWAPTLSLPRLKEPDWTGFAWEA